MVYSTHNYKEGVRLYAAQTLSNKSGVYYFGFSFLALQVQFSLISYKNINDLSFTMSFLVSFYNIING